MRATRRMLKETRRALLAAIVLSGTMSLLRLAVPFHVLWIAAAAGSGELRPAVLALTTGLVLAAILAEAIIAAARESILARGAFWLDHELGEHALAEGLKGDRSAADIGADGAALDHIRTVLTNGAAAAFADVLFVPVALIVLAALHPPLGLLASGALAIASIPMLRAGMAVARPAQEAARAQSRSQEVWSQTAASAGAIQSQMLAETAAAAWERVNRAAVGLGYALATKRGRMRATSRACSGVMLVIFLAAASALAVNWQIPFALLVASGFLLQGALGSLGRASASGAELAAAREAWSRLAALSGGPRSRQGPALSPAVGAIDLNEVFYTYPGRSVAALHSISLRLDRGRCVVVEGGAGSGKSTLLRMASGRLAPGRGHVELDGLDIAEWPQARLADAVGFAPAEPILVAGTVSQNITGSAVASRSDAAAAAMRAGVGEILAGLPRGLDTEVGDDGAGLSLRERRAVQLARALCGEPRFLVLDEPEAALDGAGIGVLRDTLAERLKSGTGILLATREPSLRALAGRVVRLERGAAAVAEPWQRPPRSAASERLAMPPSRFRVREAC